MRKTRKMAKVILGISLHSDVKHHEQAIDLTTRELKSAAHGSTIAILDGPAFNAMATTINQLGHRVTRFKFPKVKKLEAWGSAVDLLHKARESTHGQTLHRAQLKDLARSSGISEIANATYEEAERNWFLLTMLAAIDNCVG